jgi:hypothetical protein
MSKLIQDNHEDDESGSDGKTGQIGFKAFIAIGESMRDDLLSDSEKRHYIAVHEGAHEATVIKQKETVEQRKNLKEGKISLSQYRHGRSGQGGANYKEHPILADKAQLTDRQETPNPNENIAEANQDKRNELKRRHDLVHKPENAPKFNPKYTRY